MLRLRAVPTTDRRRILRLVPDFVLCLVLAAVAGCVAPIARTSSIHEGWDFELAAGPTVFRSVSVFNDSGHQLPRIEQWNMVGGLACVRGCYGFGPGFGLEGTLGMSYGEPVPRTSDPFRGWFVLDVAARSRPWTSNHAFTLEFRGAERALSLLWTGGFPSRGPERLSVTAGIGASHFALMDGRGRSVVLPQLALCCNLDLAGQRLSPTVSGAGWLSLGGEFRPMSAMAGVVWAPKKR